MPSPGFHRKAQNRIQIRYQSWDLSLRDRTLKWHSLKVKRLLNQHLLLGTIANKAEANHLPKHWDSNGHRHTGHKTQHAQGARAAEKTTQDLVHWEAKTLFLHRVRRQRFCTLSNRESPPSRLITLFKINIFKTIRTQNYANGRKRNPSKSLTNYFFARSFPWNHREE